MKKLLAGLLFLGSISSFAYTTTNMICSESKQTSAFIQIVLHEASNDQEKTFAIKTEMEFDGTVISSVKLEGNEPDFSIMKATTEEGDQIVIVSQMIDDENGVQNYQYVCAPN